MEFLEGNSDTQKKVRLVLSNFDEHIAELEKTDVETFRRKIEEAPDIDIKSGHLRRLLEQNVPASLKLLEWLLEKSKTDKLLYLEWMSHRVQVAMSLETFTRGRSLAEEAYSISKGLLEDEEGNSEEAKSPIYKAFVKACVSLLLVCRFQGKLKDAEVYLEEAKVVADSMKDEDDQDLLLILTGDLLLARGQLNKAIDTIFTPLLQKSNISLHNKGLLLQKLGNACRSAARWGEAKDNLRESIKIAKKLGDRIAEFDRVTDLGNVYRSEGRIADALQQQVPHMGFAFKRGDLWGITVACFNMGFAYYSITPNPDLNRALVLLSLKHDLAVRTDNEPLKGMALNNLGKTFCALRQYEEALKVMKESVEVARKTLNIAGEGMAYGNIGTAYRCLGKYKEAIEYHKKYLENATGRGDDGGAAIMQRELSIDYVCKGDFENAEKQARDAIETLETIRNKLGGEDASKIANFDKNQSEIYNLLQVILCRQGKSEEALALSELARSRALTDLIRDKLTGISKTEEDSWIYTTDFVSRYRYFILADYIKSADELDTNFLVYSVVKDYDANGTATQWLYIWLVLNSASAKEQGRIRFARVALSQAIQDELLIDKGFFASLTRSFKQLSMDETELLLDEEKTVEPEPEDETVLVEIPKDPEVIAFLRLLDSLYLTNVSTPEPSEEMRSQETPEPTREIPARDQGKDNAPEDSGHGDDTPKVINRLVECGSWEEEGLKQLLNLYEVCIKPINDHLPSKREDGTVPNVTIIPHEFLFSVPFCCLKEGENEEYFVERFVISYAPSLRALLLLNHRLKHLKSEQGDRKLKILAMGNPVVTLRRMDPLPKSGYEAQNVREVFDEEHSQLALRYDATKQLLLKELQKVDILHVATHACPQDIELKKTNKEKFEGDYAMRGVLLLSSSGPGCDGMAKASEIASIDCSCQLVTLSCCETGLGKVTGDGVIGLYRAFLTAGAASVLVTLWKIRDDYTLMFMKHFYNQFKETGDVPGSLRSAMVYCIREKKLPPQHWAAFSYIGAISDLRSATVTV